MLPLLLTLLLLLPINSLAQTTEQLINQQDWITRQQQNNLEEKKRDAEIEAIKKEYQRKKEEEELQQKNLITGKMAQCFEIEEIRLEGANSLSKRQIKKLTAPFIGECMEAEILEKIIKNVSQFYHDKGYITTQVKVPPQNLQSGIFILEIIEGKIEEISLGQDGFRQNLQKFSAFGDLQNEVLNINDINQGMYQINRLRSNSALMKIEPATQIGGSKIIIENDKKFPAYFSIAKDNLGNKFTGVQRLNLSSSLDNLFFFNDSLNLNYATNIHDDSSIKDFKSFSSSLSLPLQYNTFSFDYYHSQFKGQSAGINGVLILTGFSNQKKITWNRLLLGQKTLRIASDFSLALKESASYLNSQKIETSERKLSIGTFSLTISNYFQNGINLYLKPSYLKGLKILDAKQDEKNISPQTPKAQFDYFKFYGSISKKINTAFLPKGILLASEMDSQFAKQTLFGSEQFSVGGYYSVRGFRENYITGDSGYYFRNKVGFNLGDLVGGGGAPSDISPNHDLVNFAAVNFQKLLSQISLEPFFDYGYVKNKYINNGADGRLSGAGLKTIFNGKYFNAALTYSWTDGQSQLSNSNEKENQMLYFEMRVGCC